VHASLPLPERLSGAQSQAPEHFLGSDALLDLEDSKLRLRARSLTQLFATEREKALAIHNYVKKLPFERRVKLRLHTARQVLDAGCGDAPDKAALLIALLRVALIPARLSYVELKGEILRGLTSTVRSAGRPVAEIWLNGRWVRTDTYIFDTAYVAAARQRLKDRDWEWGYGIHRNGQSIWNGTDDAFLGGYPTDSDPMVIRKLGVYHDPRHYVNSRQFRSKHAPLARALHFSVLSLGMRKVVRKLREEGTPPAARDRGIS
jgi:hypothetical protein